jgi:hypothetical protein
MKPKSTTTKLADFITALIENIPVNEKSTRTKRKLVDAMLDQRDTKKKISVAIL